jgi:hypothetical protein
VQGGGLLRLGPRLSGLGLGVVAALLLAAQIRQRRRLAPAGYHGTVPRASRKVPVGPF